MSSKPQDATGASTTAPESVLRGGVLEVDGRDAAAFLHAQLMSDVRTLAPGQWHWSGWLTAKGRVIALCALLRTAPEQFWLLFPDGAVDDIATQLLRYRFRSRVELRARHDLTCVGLAAAPGAFGHEANFDRASLVGADASACWWLDFSGESQRSLVIGATHHLGQAQELHEAVVLSARAWAMEDIAHGLPRLAGGTIAGYTPQMLGLERLRAYSVKKGCYPGQEIVARTHFLGSAKRILQRLRGDAACLPGDPLERNGESVVDVLCAETDTIRHEAAAVLPSSTETSLTNRRTGHVVHVVPFAKGLAR